MLKFWRQTPEQREQAAFASINGDPSLRNIGKALLDAQIAQEESAAANSEHLAVIAGVATGKVVAIDFRAKERIDYSDWIDDEATIQTTPINNTTQPPESDFDFAG